MISQDYAWKRLAVVELLTVLDLDTLVVFANGLAKYVVDRSVLVEDSVRDDVVDTTSLEPHRIQRFP